MRLHTIALIALITASGGTATTPAADPPAVEPATEGGAGGDAAGGPDEAATAAEGEAATEAAAEGEGDAAALPDLAKLTEAQGKVHAMMAKADAEKALTEVLGAPSSTSDTEMVWMGKAGDGCKALKVQLMGDMTGGVSVEDAECPSGE